MPSTTRLLTLALAIAGTATPSAAQTLLRLAPLETYVSHSGDDTIGQQVAYEVREILARSATYPLAQTIDRADIVIHLATMDLDDPGDPGRASAVASALTYDFASIVGQPETVKKWRFVQNGTR